MSDNFVEDYVRAMAFYSEETFSEFFRLAGITDAHMQLIGRDYLGLAGGYYLSQMDKQDAAPTRGDTLKQLANAKRASRDLANSLTRAMADMSMSSALEDAGIKAGRSLKATPEQHEDTLAILCAIFPIEADGKGFRHEGFQKALATLADCLGQIEADAIAKNKRGRGDALSPWLVLMSMYWLEAKREIPSTGHYDKEIGDYDSAALAALTFAAEQLDKEISSRLIAKCLKAALDDIEHDPLKPFLLLTAGLGEIVPAGVSASGKDVLREWLGMPQNVADHVWKDRPSLPDIPKEKAQLSEEEFFETLKSSEGGKMLLQAAMAMREE